MNSYPINLLFFRTNSQICGSVEQEPPLHPRPALRGGEPRGQPRQHQVRSEGRLGRQSKGGGQHCVPGGSSPLLEFGTNDYLDLILILLIIADFV